MPVGEVQVMAFIGNVAIDRRGTFMIIFELKDSRRRTDSDLLTLVPVLTATATWARYVIVRQIPPIDKYPFTFYVRLVSKKIR
jgi:hypothetical protein